MVGPRRHNGQGLIHTLNTVVPPVGGLNSTGVISGMPETDAIEMDNMVSADLGVTVREGWRDYAINIGGTGSPIRTVVSYEGAPANSTVSPLSQSSLFAVTDLGIFDVTGGGDMTALVPDIALSGATYAGRLSSVQFTTDAGQYLVSCSEIDGGYLYDGTAWMQMTSVGGPGPGIITGVNPSTFVQVCAYKKRLMFVERGTARVWILPVGQVGGVAQVFDFGPLLSHGGSVVALMNWTQDAGEGMDDRLVILGSSGDLLVYQGNDPTSAAQFAAVGTWFVGQPPVGRRCFTTSGGNCFVLTKYGVIPVNEVVQGGLDNLLTSGTDLIVQLRKLQDLLNVDFRSYLNAIGWELLDVPTKATLLIARPSSSVTEHVQYAFNQHNLAWSRFFDIPATTYALRLQELYGGTEDGRVIRVLDGATDAMDIDGENGQEIRARLTPAFSYMGAPTVQKMALMLRANFLASQKPGWNVRMNVDFSLNPVSQTAVSGGSVGSLWDASLWDAAYWSGGRASFAEWRSVEALGYAMAPTLYVSAEVPTILASLEYMTKNGGPL